MNEKIIERIIEVKLEEMELNHIISLLERIEKDFEDYSYQYYDIEYIINALIEGRKNGETIK